MSTKRERRASLSGDERVRNEQKKERLLRTFDSIAQLLVLAFVAMLIYYDGLMILPHVAPLFWAVVWAVVLYRPITFVRDLISALDAKLDHYRSYVIPTSAS